MKKKVVHMAKVRLLARRMLSAILFVVITYSQYHFPVVTPGIDITAECPSTPVWVAIRLTPLNERSAPLFAGSHVAYVGATPALATEGVPVFPFPLSSVTVVVENFVLSKEY